MNHYVLEGPEHAPVVVFSSSLGTTHEMWDAQAAAFADEFRVLRYDHRGHGGSPGAARARTRSTSWPATCSSCSTISASSARRSSASRSAARSA